MNNIVKNRSPMHRSKSNPKSAMKYFIIANEILEKVLTNGLCH